MYLYLPYNSIRLTDKTIADMEFKWCGCLQWRMEDLCSFVLYVVCMGHADFTINVTEWGYTKASIAEYKKEKRRWERKKREKQKERYSIIYFQCGFFLEFRRCLFILFVVNSIFMWQRIFNRAIWHKCHHHHDYKHHSHCSPSPPHLLLPINRWSFHIATHRQPPYHLNHRHDHRHQTRSHDWTTMSAKMNLFICISLSICIYLYCDCIYILYVYFFICRCCFWCRRMVT